MDYDAEISALKTTVLELLDVCETQSRQYREVSKKYTQVNKEYKEVCDAFKRKDEAFQEIVQMHHVQKDKLDAQVNKLSELEDVLEDMA